jgi:hypothetical protein
MRGVDMPMRERSCKQPSRRWFASLLLAALAGLALVVGSVTVVTAQEQCRCRIGGVCVPDSRCAPRPTTRSRTIDPAPPSARLEATVPGFDLPTTPGPNGRRNHRYLASRGPASTIADTAYAHLTAPGREKPGYGLYSYAIMPSNTPHAAAFLAEIFSQVKDAESRPISPDRLNVLYLPMQGDKRVQFSVLQKTAGQTPEKLGESYASSYYDYDAATALLYHMCNAPHDNVRDVCGGAMSRGPYIFTYAAPASQMETVPPPFLFVDLSNVHPKAYAELIDAFRTQVKSDDITDGAKIKTLRLRLLDIFLRAADLVEPAQAAVANIVHSAGGGEDKK